MEFAVRDFECLVQTSDERHDGAALAPELWAHP